MGNVIATVRGTNMNPGIPQCKNCWKWGHLAGVCQIQGSKCTKFNGPHLTDNHHDFAWCCKANDKLNPPRLETKKSEPCSHSFKCLNCKGPHVADSVECPFWKHRFNKEWHSKEYTKLREARRTSIHSNMNDSTIWFWTNWKYFYKTFKRTTSSLIWSLKLIKTLTSYSSKSHCWRLLETFQALQILKAFLY